jgi:hypothetical protein
MRTTKKKPKRDKDNPTYVGSMFIETDGGVVEIGMMEFNGKVMPGGIRDANTHRVPDVPPTETQMREALELAMWCKEHEQVFEGICVHN